MAEILFFSTFKNYSFMYHINMCIYKLSLRHDRMKLLCDRLTRYWIRWLSVQICNVDVARKKDLGKAICTVHVLQIKNVLVEKNESSTVQIDFSRMYPCPNTVTLIECWTNDYWMLLLVRCPSLLLISHCPPATVLQGISWILPNLTILMHFGQTSTQSKGRIIASLFFLSFLISWFFLQCPYVIVVICRN